MLGGSTARRRLGAEGAGPVQLHHHLGDRLLGHSQGASMDGRRLHVLCVLSSLFFFVRLR